MSALGEPYISADESPMELTVRAVIVGIVLGVLMTAANAYLGLYAGMTVSASIPAAVMLYYVHYLRMLQSLKIMQYKLWQVPESHLLQELFSLSLHC